MIIPHKKAANPGAPRSPDMLYLDSAAGWPLENSADNALKVSAVYRAVTFCADTISVMPCFVMDQQTHVRDEKHPLLPVLTVRPNEGMSPTDYKRLMEANRLIHGSGYAYIRRDPRTGRVVELLPLMPDLVNIQMDVERHLHYLYTDPLSGKCYDLMPSQVIHYKAFSYDGINGISPLQFARDVIAKDRAAKAYERALYNNGGRPSGVLYTEADLAGASTVVDEVTGKTLSKKEVVRRAWERVHSGGDNAFRTAVLDLGLKYQPIAMNNTDAQFVESNDITIADIARFFGVPLHVLMSGKQSYESNEQNRVEFVQTTALATVTACEDEDSYKLLSGSDREKNLRICRNMNAALRGDTDSRAKWYREMHELGAYNVDEIRAEENLPAVPGGQARKASLNFIPLEHFERLSIIRNGGKNEDQ